MAFERIRNLRPVKRYRSERYVLISLAAFALTVIVLRGVLKLTGYAQIGTDTIHIAHVLWGGLALFAGALLLLIFSNRWALGVGAVLCGSGVGLFIDEVGKFVTQSNDYFTPAAAPIIYALFLATVLVYLRVRRPPSRDVRGEMYRALEQMSGVLDREMSRHDLNVLHRRLVLLQTSSEDEAVCRLATAMLEFIDSQRARIVESQPSRTQLILTYVRAWGRRVFTRPRLRIFLVVALVAFGIWAVLDMALLAFLAVAPASRATELLRSLVSPDELAALGDKIWFSVRAVLEGGVGVAMLCGGILMGLRREWRGSGIAIGGLIVALTAVDLLVFYQDQIKALIEIALQYVLLVAAFSYRRIYLEDEAEEAGRAGARAEAEFASALRAAAEDAGCSRRSAP
jgi:hypothetical protein